MSMPEYLAGRLKQDGTNSQHFMFSYLIHKINKKIARSLPHEGIVIDLGCGGAPYKQDILRIAERYIGVDWQNSRHDQSNVDVYADLNKQIPFDNHYADTIVSFQVLEHLPDPNNFLSECYRILKPAGHLFITAPFMWHVHEEPHDYLRCTRYGLEILLKKTALSDINIEENTDFWQMWVSKFNCIPPGLYGHSGIFLRSGYSVRSWLPF